MVIMEFCLVRSLVSVGRITLSRLKMVLLFKLFGSTRAGRPAKPYSTDYY